MTIVRYRFGIGPRIFSRLYVLFEAARKKWGGGSISWLGYQATRDELFRKVSAAKISSYLLTTILFRVPSLKVCSLACGGQLQCWSISELNDEEECVLWWKRGYQGFGERGDSFAVQRRYVSRYERAWGKMHAKAIREQECVKTTP